MKTNNTFRLDSSLTSQKMAFDTLQVKAVEGLLLVHENFANTIGHRSTGTSSTWCGQEREIGESEMSQTTSSYKGKYISNYLTEKTFKLGQNDFKLGRNGLGAKHSVS